MTLAARLSAALTGRYGIEREASPMWYHGCR